MSPFNLDQNSSAAPNCQQPRCAQIEKLNSFVIGTRCSQRREDCASSTLVVLVLSYEMCLRWVQWVRVSADSFAAKRETCSVIGRGDLPGVRHLTGVEWRSLPALAGLHGLLEFLFFFLIQIVGSLFQAKLFLISSNLFIVFSLIRGTKLLFWRWKQLFTFLSV